MGAGSVNSYERNERKHKGKSPATRMVASESSNSPPTARSVGVRIGPKNPSKTKPPTHKPLSSSAINKKLRRFLEFSEASRHNTDSSFEQKKELFEKNMKLFYEGLAEVDKVLGRVVSKVSPKIQKMILESPQPRRSPTPGNSSQDESVEFIEHICVLVYNGTLDDDVIWYEMNPGDRFKHIFEDYASKLDTTPDKIIMHCTGCNITPETTVEMSGVKDGDHIGVKGFEDFYFNTNTRLKQITFVEAVDKDAVKWTTTFLKTEKIEEVYNQWAEYSGYKIEEFYLLHNMLEVLKVGTLADYSIKNGSIMYCGKYLQHQIWDGVDPSEEF